MFVQQSTKNQAVCVCVMHEHTCCIGALASEEVEWFVQLLLFSFKDANNIEQEKAFGMYFALDRQPPARSRDLSLLCLKGGLCKMPSMSLCPATSAVPVPAVKEPCYIQSDLVPRKELHFYYNHWVGNIAIDYDASWLSEFLMCCRDWA